MRLFGLSSLDALLSLLLVELVWWGYVFFGQFLWILVYFAKEYFQKQEITGTDTVTWDDILDEEQHKLGGDIFVSEYVTLEHDSTLGRQEQENKLTHLGVILIYGILLLLRLKTPLLLLITVLRNKVNQHCQLLRIWYMLTIILDLGIIAFVGFLKATTLNMQLILTSGLLPFLMFRVIFWSVAKTVVSELSVKESSLFPVVGCKGFSIYIGSNVKSALHILLSWEIIFNSVLLLSSVSYLLANNVVVPGSYYGSYDWAEILPNTYTYPDMMGYVLLFGGWSINIVVIVLSSLLLLAVEKRWKSFTIFLIVLYIVFGLIGYLTLHVSLTLRSLWAFSQYRDHVENLITYASSVLLAVMEFGQVCLRLLLIKFALQFASTKKNDLDSEKEHRSACQPLLSDELIKGKDANYE